ncbi:hypothetical protein KRR39_12500 [Nocardioides panacis]|uniref:DUF4386 family protein n=1 Tax=Nocardioides panacis TaxID=2849501 RepID=A0A975SV82_9ACTN|nr:hypothetical protein [Nocardioides panacis]QWZ06417.1 hypothetical protein KRR39_12500 [Nocardioides panacis]
MSVEQRVQRTSRRTDRGALQLSATLLLVGQLAYVLVTQFHAGGHANDHRAIFATYAGSGAWKGVHVGQFLAMVVVVAGLVVFHQALGLRAGGAAAAARVGAVLAVVALALYAVLQGVDGVGNQQVDAAWAHASATDRPARFASAEAVRWLEWGVRSYHDYALGLALVLLGIAATAVRATPVPTAVGWLMAGSGAAYLVQGWVVGAQGFSGTHTILILVAWALSLVWMIWLGVVLWRKPHLERID